ncbi:MAG: hypothetical protein U9N49_09240 [Campylobacterota bacterium]|nr:hypothetical protein [Campylobacterota bacterium]
MSNSEPWEFREVAFVQIVQDSRARAIFVTRLSSQSNFIFAKIIFVSEFVSHIVD